MTKRTKRKMRRRLNLWHVNKRFRRRIESVDNEYDRLKKSVRGR